MAFDLRQPILKCIEPVYTNLRAQKLKLLLQLLGAAEQGSLLDLGGNQGFSGEFLPLYRRFKKVVVVNVVDSKIKCEGHDGISRVIGDGCCLPFRDGAFDWVFSNAVIEHVGDWKKRQQFAGEIRRVASKGYFVTTPNKWFPIDPHTLVPLYQFVPGRLQRELIRYSPGPMTKYEEIKLLSRGQVQSLFPGSVVLKSGLPVFPNSIISYWQVEPSLRQGFPHSGQQEERIVTHSSTVIATGA
ncbi:MAG: methyltransferase domain-containing protein [Terriglobia bacterium]